MGKNDDRHMRYLSETELVSMQNSGLVEIEPHTKSHVKLTRSPLESARMQIEESKHILESIRKKPCITFAPPWGMFDNAIIDLVRSAGFLASVGVHEGTVSAHADPFRLPRNSIDRSTTMMQFKGKVSRAIDGYVALSGACQ